MITDPQVARRKAQVIVSDIALYNEDKVKKGIEEDTLLDLLREEIEEGRKYLASLLDEKLLQENDFLNEALVDILFKAAGKYKSKIW
jgi:hypothetical protein